MDLPSSQAVGAGRGQQGPGSKNPICKNIVVLIHCRIFNKPYTWLDLQVAAILKSKLCILPR